MADSSGGAIYALEGDLTSFDGANGATTVSSSASVPASATQVSRTLSTNNITVVSESSMTIAYYDASNNPTTPAAADHAVLTRNRNLTRPPTTPQAVSASMRTGPFTDCRGPRRPGR